VPDEKRKKLDSKVWECIFVGYEDTCKAWRFYHPTTRTLMVSRDANFDEGMPGGEELQGRRIHTPLEH